MRYVFSLIAAIALASPAAAYINAGFGSFREYEQYKQLLKTNPAAAVAFRKEIDDRERARVKAEADRRRKSQIQPWTAAIQRDRKNAFAYYHRGVCWQGFREPGNAAEDFDSAIALDPTMARAYLRRGVLRWAEGEQESALADFKKSVQLDDRDFVAQAYLALSYAEASEKLRDLGSAQTHAARACELARNAHWGVLEVLAYCQACSGKFDEAKATQQKAMNTTPFWGSSRTIEAYEQRRLPKFDASFRSFALLSLGPGEPTVFPVWPEAPPGEKAVLKERVLPARAGETPPTTRITDVGMPTLTYFAPRKERSSTIVMICPGGGYSYLTYDKEGTEVAAWLNDLGLWAAVLKYRTPRREGDAEHNAPLQDAQRALRVLRKDHRWAKVGIMGFSAGGNLAVAAATRFDKPAYEKIDPIDAHACRPDFAVPIYPAYLTNKGAATLLDRYPVSKDTPPCFLVHAHNDGVPAENSVALYAALHKAGVPAELHIYAAGGHGFGVRPSHQPISQWPQRCEEWFYQQRILIK